MNVEHPSRMPLAAKGPASSEVRAFTLIEMLVVVVLISIMAGAVSVSFQGRQEVHALRCSAKDLAAALEFAATEARDRQIGHRVAFTDQMRCFRVESVSPAGQWAPVPSRPGRPRPLAQRVRVQSVIVDGKALDCLPEAFEFGAGQSFAGRISLVSEGGQAAMVEVVAGTAEVTIDE